MKYYVVDSFADKLFSGNPAGVCLVEHELDAQTMQNIAAENNLSETAFVKRNGDSYDLRWFTPEIEVDLCGHATLASAFVVTNFWDKGKREMRFNTQSGELRVSVKQDDLYEMDFPAWEPKPVEVTPLMSQAVGAQVLEAHLSRDLLLLVGSEENVVNLAPDFNLLCELPDCVGVIVTAKGNSADFVSRFFAPGAGVPEDPVTGSAHAQLIPFWAKRLDKKVMTARQLSKRGGELFCEYCGDRVKISGKAVLYMQGEIVGL